jgi:hypothetical protein
MHVQDFAGGAMAGRRYKGRHTLSARPQLSLAGDPDDVARAQEFTAAHPDVVISFADGIYTARRDGEEIAHATRLGALLSQLEASGS